MKLFKTAEIAKFTQKEYMSYEDSLKYYRDLKNSLDTAKEEGIIEGKIERSVEIAKSLLKNNIDIDIIIASTGLTKEQINNISE